MERCSPRHPARCAWRATITSRRNRCAASTSSTARRNPCARGRAWPLLHGGGGRRTEHQCGVVLPRSRAPWRAGSRITSRSGMGLRPRASRRKAAQLWPIVSPHGWMATGDTIRHTTVLPAGNGDFLPAPCLAHRHHRRAGRHTVPCRSNCAGAVRDRQCRNGFGVGQQSVRQTTPGGSGSAGLSSRSR